VVLKASAESAVPPMGLLRLGFSSGESAPSGTLRAVVLLKRPA
jgi:hypothetical protein